MITYQYTCSKCKKKFELRQSIKDSALTTCKDCGGRLIRLIGTGSCIIFKGSGFYVNDYGRK